MNMNPLRHTLGGILTRLVMGLLVASVSTSALSDVFIDEFPYQLNFESTDYESPLLWMTGGCEHEWAPTGGWQGSGAAKFYPPTRGDSYCGLGHFAQLRQHNTQDIYISFLFKTGLQYANSMHDGNKLIILNRYMPDGDPDIYRMMSILKWRNTDQGRYATLSACHNIACRFETGWHWPRGGEDFQIGSELANYSDQWVFLRFHGDAATGTVSLYALTEGGAYDRTIAEITNADVSGSIWDFIDIIGGYWQASDRHPDNFFMFDHLTISDEPTAPPVGFGNTLAPPEAPRIDQLEQLE